MNHDNQFEHRTSSSRSMHVGESSYALCDRPSRTRDTSQRQLSTDQDYAVSTREYQTDQSSLKSAPTAARPVLGKRPMQRQPHSCAGVDRVTPYQYAIFVPLLMRGCIYHSCSSCQRFVCGFLQIPPRDGHPCRSANTSLAGRVEDFHLQVSAPCQVAGHFSWQSAAYWRAVFSIGLEGALTPAIRPGASGAISGSGPSRAIFKTSSI